MGVERACRVNGTCKASRASWPALAVLTALLAVAAGCGPGRGGRATAEADGAVDIGGDGGPVALAPTDGIGPPGEPSPLAALAPPTDAPPSGGADADNLEVIDVPDDDIEELLDATRIAFATFTIEMMCLAPERFADLIIGGPQVIVSQDVRLAKRATVVARGFAPGVPIDARVLDPYGEPKATLRLAADGNGCAVGGWIVSPDGLLGDHVVRATDGAATAELVVPVQSPDAPTLIVSPNEVQAGGEVTVALAGYAPGERLTALLYVLEQGRETCAAAYSNDCWRFRTAWRTPATNARGGLIFRLPAARGQAGETYLVTTKPRPEMFPRDVQNDDLLFTLVDR